jgi:hypothetical protein
MKFIGAAALTGIERALNVVAPLDALNIFLPIIECCPVAEAAAQPQRLLFSEPTAIGHHSAFGQ